MVQFDSDFLGNAVRKTKGALTVQAGGPATGPGNAARATGAICPERRLPAVVNRPAARPRTSSGNADNATVFSAAGDCRICMGRWSIVAFYYNLSAACSIASTYPAQ